MSNNTSNRGLKVALGIAIALFLGAVIYTASLYAEKKENEKVLTEEKAKVLNELTAMQAQYDVALTENTVANENLEAARDRIQGLIDSLQVSETNIKSLWKYKTKYIDLQEEMVTLLDINDKLKVNNQLLSTSLDSTKTQLSSTKTQLQERTVFTDSLLVQNTALANVVETAAVLYTNSLNASGVIERSSGKQIPTERARRSDKIRVCFTVAKNTLVETGDKELYVQVIDPKNNVLGANAQKVFGDKTLNYSLISTFNYENNSLDICEYITKVGKTDFEKGTYKVNVFNGKTLVSNALFTMK